ncbi:PQQ-dependent sugar dehydrogenase [Polymorphospora rubra]|uniref:PQQ-dependent sugar dehydrogenase n=1 Tax=Polymorphospora rubra TaxID=338584 RepID=UPI0033C9FE88
MSKPRWLQKRHRTIALAAAAALVATLPATPASAGPTNAPNSSNAPVTDPIPEDPTPATLGLVVEEFATFPKSEPVPAPTDQRLVRHARINYLGEVPDGSGRLYVPDLNGKLYLVEDGVNHDYLDVGATFAPDFWSGRGLGSGFGFVTFHPKFAENGKFYTTHTEAGAALTSKTPDFTTQPNTVVHSVVTEWTATDPAADTFSGTRREVMRIGFATYIHAIQQIDFNPTAKPRDDDYGLLYIAVGDGGIGVNTDEPQNLGTPQGKILRVDPLGTNSTTGRWGIPKKNPFVKKAGALDEIYAYGMRDPHRFSWDPGTNNRMFLGHIGEHAIEAVYEVRAGDNLGWSVREGAFVFDKNDRCNLYPLPKNDRGYVYPVAAYDHDPPAGWPCTSDSGHAISGGFVYRGDLPALRGKYVFGDLVEGRVFYTEATQMRRNKDKLAKLHQLQILDQAGNRVNTQDLAGDGRVDLRFGTDADGELYLLSKANGKIWKVTDTRRVKADPDVHPSIERSLAAYYDFETIFPPDRSLELDKGYSGTNIRLVNGGPEMRVKDGAYPGSNTSIQTRQVNPTVAGNDDWKAGIFNENGVPTLNAFNRTQGTTVMGWFKLTGPHSPALNSNTANPDDRYNAIGLAGILTGDSDGHGVRALLELINVNGELRLVALGRRLDGGASQTFAASEDWRTLMPQNEWVHLAATFDFDKGTMALYRNGEKIDGFYTATGDPWQVAGEGPHYTTPTDPRGIKIGGSYPQDTREQNPCDCRMDALMFLDRVVTPSEVRAQYRLVTTGS